MLTSREEIFDTAFVSTVLGQWTIMLWAVAMWHCNCSLFVDADTKMQHYGPCIWRAYTYLCSLCKCNHFYLRNTLSNLTEVRFIAYRHSSTQNVCLRSP